ncbi:MAG: PEP-CTERM sorting domain-containing protein [Desulfobacterales bacterium]
MKIKKLAAGMRKKLAVLTIASVMFVFGAAGNASAYFEDLHLVRVMWDTTKTVEWGTDLGVAISPTYNGTTDTWNTYGKVGGLMNASDFNGGFSNVKVGYFAADNNGARIQFGNYWIAGGYNDGDGLTLSGNKVVTLNTTSGKVQSTYTATGLSTGNVLQTNSNNYAWVADKNGLNIGSFGANLMDASYEATQLLTALGGGDHYYDMMLYFFDYNQATLPVNGAEAAIVRTYMTAGTDGNYDTLGDNIIGTEIINPNAVPVPPSVLLLGTGLLGMFGIRRRMA